MNPSSFMEVSREAARLEASCQWRERKVAIPLDLISQEDGYTPDPSLMEIIK